MVGKEGRQVEVRQVREVYNGGMEKWKGVNDTKGSEERKEGKRDG